MALVDPVGFGTCRPEHRQILLQSWRAKEEKDAAASQSCTLLILPLGFPLFLDSELAWSPSDIQVKLDHTYHLTHEDKAEIDNALKSFKSLYYPWHYLSLL
jgi:hypothetical protein